MLSTFEWADERTGSDGTPNSVSACWEGTLQWLADTVIGVPHSAFSFPILGFQLFSIAVLPPDMPAAKRQQTGPGNRAPRAGFGNGSNGQVINC